MAATPATALRSVESCLHPDYIEGKKRGAEITELCAYIYAATYRLLVLIREFDEKKLWAEPGLCSCAHWLNFKCGIGMNAAREKVRVAHALKSLPKISDGFRKGELSYSKVRAITRAATSENEDALMNLGRHGTAAHVERVVASYRRAKRLQDVETANEQHRDRTLDYFYDADGSLVIKGRFPAEKGALIIKALEMAMDCQFVGARSPRGTADAGEASDVSAETSDETDDPDDSGQHEPADARRADALSEVAETYLNHNESSASTGDRYQVVVHVSAETSDAHMDDGPHVSAETSQCLTKIRKKSLMLGDDTFGLVIFDVRRVVAFFKNTAHQDDIGAREHMQKSAIDECIPVDAAEGHVIDSRVGRHKYQLSFGGYEIIVAE